MSEMPAYNEVNEALESIKGHMNAAEAHGMVCAFICAGAQMDGKSWINSILGNHSLSREELEYTRGLLLKIYEISSIKLQNMEFDFELLLPDDDACLSIRSEALSHWCQGFVMALQRTGINMEQYISHDVKEAVQHILEISQLDYDNIAITEEDERAYLEVMEYVRMAVLMVFTEIDQDQGGKKNPLSKRLH